jgi:hypothetical protein
MIVMKMRKNEFFQSKDLVVLCENVCMFWFLNVIVFHSLLPCFSIHFPRMLSPIASWIPFIHLTLGLPPSQ